MTEISPADIAVLSRNNFGYGGYGDGFGFGGGGLWLFAILAMMMFGGNGFGWGNNGFANAIGYNNLATQNDVQRGFDTQALSDQSRDILAAVSAGTAQTTAAINQAKYDNINVAKDIQVALTSELGRLETAGADILAKQNECCCNTLRAIDGVNYNSAINTAAINANTTAQTQKILDAINANQMEMLRGRIGQLELQQAVSGVVRYPSASTYSAGSNPFCSCGCSQFA